jgi:hypothetical protein
MRLARLASTLEADEALRSINVSSTACAGPFHSGRDWRRAFQGFASRLKLDFRVATETIES